MAVTATTTTRVLTTALEEAVATIPETTMMRRSKEPSASSSSPINSNRMNRRIRRRRTRPPSGTTTMSPSPGCLSRIIIIGLAAIVMIYSSTLVVVEASGYHRAPCKKVSVRRQFQFSDCYVPQQNPDLYLNRASFVMAHDAATGYLNVNNKNDDDNDNNNSGASNSQYLSEYDGVDDMNSAEYQGGEYNGNGNGNNNNNNGNNNNYQNNAAHPSRWNTITTKLLSLYGKTQSGTVYTQLNDGARALDLRPKIYNNGTIGFHHGSLIDIPLTSITLTGLLADAKQWCNDNPKELVLIFHSELVHEAGYNGLSSQVYLEADDDDDANNNNNNNYNNGGDDGYANNNNGDDDGGGAANNNDDYDDANQVYDDAYDDGNNNDDQADDGAQQQQYQYEYYYSGIAKLKEIYEESGVPYYPCEKMAGLTVAQAMELANLKNHGGKGYLLAVDRHDMYGSFCGKANWAQDQLVTCHERYYGEQNRDGNENNDNRDDGNNNNYGSNNPQSYIHCTDTKGTGIPKLSALQTYVAASTNNDASDDSNELGPPADESYYPFNQIQGFWQVDATSVQIGIMHASNLLDDNMRSQVNEEMVKMAYNGEFDAISIFALDNVALNGNAMLSVLRNACGQSVVKNDGTYPACGKDLVMPYMQVSHKLPLVWNIVLFVVYGALVLMVSIMLFQAFRLRNEGPQEHRLICHGHVV